MDLSRFFIIDELPYGALPGYHVPGRGWAYAFEHDGAYEISVQGTRVFIPVEAGPDLDIPRACLMLVHAAARRRPIIEVEDEREAFEYVQAQANCVYEDDILRVPGPAPFGDFIFVSWGLGRVVRSFGLVGVGLLFPERVHVFRQVEGRRPTRFERNVEV